MIPDVLEQARARLLALPELRDWPDAAALLGYTSRARLPCWELPLVSCAAVGAPSDRALPAAAAILSLLLGIHIVDDVLDEEPRGLHRQIGAGGTANLALALQAAAVRMGADAELDPAVRAAVQRSLATAALATSYGQHLDTLPIATEADYWRTADAKTPPLFRCALEIGALSGGASEPLADAIGALGVELGRFIQVSDDLNDALARPAGPDWRRRGGNLALLYATLAPHAGRARFLELCERVDDAAALVEAQELLWRSGAVAYCTHQLIEQYRGAMRRLAALALADPAPLAGLLDAHAAPVTELLREAGVADAERLLRG